ncbi:GEVED domain-containing protein [uncultured Shewanella sp.]|uniref:GEVED domain-containing protein n=1 Tax=uncultured Shewanella sp. TaxID=173975 RepID=UPI00261631F0|nr:GEVED domain-containing protein [uncultured Shewanella sp.]
MHLYKIIPLLAFTFPSMFNINAVQATTFAAIGDYGDSGSERSDVANLIDSWDPEFIITLGDNDYEYNYNVSVVPYYGHYISSNCTQNRFYPSFGNHDWNGTNGYDDVFPCTGSQYQFTKDNIEFFTINSDSLSNSQITWLQTELGNSTATWKVVFFHHPPYSSGAHGNNSFMQLNYADWGADIVLGGHDHSYERIERDGIHYFVNGLGGRGRYGFDNCCVSGSQKRYNSNYGAMRFDVNGNDMRIRFINRSSSTIDDITLTKNPDNTEPQYCNVSGGTDYEYIKKITIDSFENHSNGSGLNGYSDFTTQTITLNANSNMPITLTPGFVQGAYTEHWKVWVDFNQDGDFNDNGETLLSGLSGSTELTDQVSLPAIIGTTRMRIAMKYNSEPLSACGYIGDGEVEDYTITIE